MDAGWEEGIEPKLKSESGVNDLEEDHGLPRLERKQEGGTA